MIEEKSFLGRGWSFPPEIGKGASPTKMVSQEEDIRQSLFILFNTHPGERIHRTYGCDLRQFLFESITETVKTRIMDIIEQAVLLYEPRIILEKVHINTESELKGYILIDLTYTIRMTNKRSNMVYPFYLREGTDL